MHVGTNIDRRGPHLCIADDVKLGRGVRLSKFINLYAEDCWIMVPNALTLCGPDAPGGFFQTAYNKLGIRNGKFITTDVYGIREGIVAEIGFWKLYNIGNIEFDDGKFLRLWKKTPKGWKIWRDSFSSSRSRK